MDNRESNHPTLVLIHAFPFDNSMWEPQRAALAGSVDLYTPDLPGFGAQSRLDGESFSMELAARFVQGELNARGIDRCILGGLSMGGYVAFECWRLFPEKIAGMILADTKASADSEEARKGRYAAVERIAGGDYHGYIEELLGKLLSEKTRRDRPDVVDHVRSLALATLPETAMAALLGMAVRNDSTDLLPTIDVPTLLIFGEDDAITTIEEGRTMEEKIPNATLKLVKNAGHLANVEGAEEFDRAILDFRF
jgi:pimeloyl-ACP methyl ester carboxylesterase